MESIQPYQSNFQYLVNRTPAVLNNLILPKLGLKPDRAEFRWVSPVEANHHETYNNEQFLEALGLGQYAGALKSFWPMSSGQAGGPVWDGLATVKQDHSLLNGFVLVNVFEGKSSFTQSGCQATDPASRKLIEERLEETKAWLKVDSNINWMGSRYYPYAARLAHLFFLKEMLKIKNAWMVDLVLGDGSLASKTIPLKAVHDELGLEPVQIPGRVRVDIENPIRAKSGVERCRVCNVYDLCHRSAPVSETELIKAPPEWVEYGGHTRIERERFEVGKTEISVLSNVYYLPAHLLNEAQVAIDLVTIGAEGIRRQMVSVIHALREYSEKSVPVQGRVDDCMGELERIKLGVNEDSVAGDVELLQSWDRIMAELLDRPEDSPCPPLKQFLRNGFFNPHSREYKGRIYPAGCYVLLDESETRDRGRSVVAEILHLKDQTRLHELAHAAMAVNREKGSVAGCRWMEEAFAEYLMGSKLGFNQCRPSRCELDVYLVWQYLVYHNSVDQVEELLQRWLSSQPLCAFCNDVQSMRKSVGH